jgi:hypothetical protein
LHTTLRRFKTIFKPFIKTRDHRAHSSNHLETHILAEELLKLLDQEGSFLQRLFARYRQQLAKLDLIAGGALLSEMTFSAVYLVTPLHDELMS